MSQTPNQPRQQAPSQPNSGGPDFSLPSPSTRTIIVIAIAGVALWFFVRRLSSSDDGDGDADDAENGIDVPEEVREKFDDVEEDSDTIEIPINPDSELEKDEALIEGLKEGGHLEVLGD